MIKYFFSIINYIFYLGIIRNYCCLFFNQRTYSHTKKGVIWGSLFGINFLFLNNLKTHYLFTFFLQTLILVIFIFLLYESSISKSMIFTFLGSIFAALIEVIINICLNSFGLSDSYLQLAGSVISKLILFTFIELINQKVNFIKYNSISMPFLTWILFVVIPLISIIIIYIIFMLDSNILDNAIHYGSILASFLLLAVNIGMFYIYKQLTFHIESEKKTIIYSQQFKQISKQISENDTLMQQINKEYHDFKNKIVFINELAKNAKNQEIIEYLKPT